jgi:hypothetical protein
LRGGLINDGDGRDDCFEDIDVADLLPDDACPAMNAWQTADPEKAVAREILLIANAFFSAL